MVVASVSVFNEYPGIVRAIRSVIDVVDEVRVYDGAYATYPHGNHFSTDGTLDRVRDTFGDAVRIVEAPKAYENQLAKRSRILADAARKTLVIVDGDEWIANPAGLREALRIFARGRHDVGWVELVSNLYAAPYRQPRIFRVRKGWHYAGRHHWIFDDSGNLVASHRAVTRRYSHAMNLDVKLYNVRRHERGRDKASFRRKRNPTELRFKSESEVYGAKDKLITPKCVSPERTRKAFQEVLSSADGTPPYTVTAMFSRVWAVRPWFEWFRRVSLPWEDAELLIVVDGERSLGSKVAREMRALEPAYGARLYVTGARAPGERGTGRRDRIIANWNLLLPEVRGEVLLGTEDDTFPQLDAYDRLIALVESGEAAFAQASVLGRWSIRMVPHWRVNYVGSRPQAVLSGRPPRKGAEMTVEIQGGGWYCFACRTDVAREVGVRRAVEVPLGPDVQFVLDLAQAGHRCVGLWDVWCDHLTAKGPLRPEDPRGIERCDYLRRGDKWSLQPRRKLGAWQPDRSAVPVSPARKTEVGPVARREAPPRRRSRGDKPVKIVTLMPKRTIMIEGRLFPAPPAGGPFEMNDVSRAELLAKQGKARIVREEDFYGVPFTGARLPSSVGKAPPDEPLSKKDRAKKVAEQRKVLARRPKVGPPPTKVKSFEPDEVRGKKPRKRPTTRQKKAGYDPAKVAETAGEAATQPKAKKKAEKPDAVDPGGRANDPVQCHICNRVIKKRSSMKAHMAAHRRRGEIPGVAADGEDIDV